MGEASHVSDANETAGSARIPSSEPCQDNGAMTEPHSIGSGIEAVVGRRVLDTFRAESSLGDDSEQEQEKRRVEDDNVEVAPIPGSPGVSGGHKAVVADILSTQTILEGHPQPQPAASEEVGLQPLPSGDSGAARRQSQTTPGAFASYEQRYYNVNDPRVPRDSGPEQEPSPPADTASQQQDRNLVVANLIDSSSHLDLPQAENVDLDSSRRKREKSKQVKTNILAGVGVLMIIVIILVAVLVPRTSQNQDIMAITTTTTPNNSTPSQAPTTVEDQMLEQFPEATVLTILDDPNSPQAQAFQWLLEDTDHHVLSNDQMMQRFALATLYYATSGDQWNNNDNWINHGVHECQWYTKPEFAMQSVISRRVPGYIEDFFPQKSERMTNCNDDGLYQHLWLDQNRLDGTLPEELYWLSSLQTLSLGPDPKLHGTLSTQIGQLSQLEGFSLIFSQVQGTLPTEIGTLSRMRFIGLTASQFKGTIPTEFWQLQNLDSVGFALNRQIQGTIPTEVGTMPKLRWLVMNECDITGTIPTEIGQVETLEWLTLYKNRLTGTFPSELGKLSQMLNLNMHHNFFEGTLPSELGLLTSSTRLLLHSNQFSGTIPTELGLLTELTLQLTLGDNQFFPWTLPTELGLLTSLEELSFDNNQFTGGIPSEFGQLAAMGHLSFVNNSLSGSIPTELSALQPSLYTLNLKGNPLLSGAVPEALCHINGSCIVSFNALDPCLPPFGLSFDCTSTLCGCGCSCQDKR